MWSPHIYPKGQRLGPKKRPLASFLRERTLSGRWPIRCAAAQFSAAVPSGRHRTPRGRSEDAQRTPSQPASPRTARASTGTWRAKVNALDRTAKVMTETSESSACSGRIVSRHAGRRALLTFGSRRCLRERHGAGGLVLPESSSFEGGQRRYRTYAPCLVRPLRSAVVLWGSRHCCWHDSSGSIHSRLGHERSASSHHDFRRTLSLGLPRGLRPRNTGDKRFHLGW